MSSSYGSRNKNETNHANIWRGLRNKSTLRNSSYKLLLRYFVGAGVFDRKIFEDKKDLMETSKKNADDLIPRPPKLLLQIKTFVSYLSDEKLPSRKGEGGFYFLINKFRKILVKQIEA